MSFIMSDSKAATPQDANTALEWPKQPHCADFNYHKMSTPLLLEISTELDRITKILGRTYSIVHFCGVVLTVCTIVFNAIIIMAKGLNVTQNVESILAGGNTLIKGLEMYFKFEHRSEQLKKLNG